MKQYPHFLYSLESSGDSAQDSDGNYTAQSLTPVLQSECREVSNGRGSEIQGADGKFYKFASVIQLPLSCPDIPFATKVYVRNSETTTVDRIKGTVLKFDRGQMHCRLWV